MILLNFLISVIGDTYGEIMGRKVVNSYTYKNQLNIDFLRIRHVFKEPQELNCMIFIADKEKRQLDDNSLEKIRDDVITHIDDSNKKIHSRIDSLEEKMGEMMNGINEKIDKLIQQ